MEGAAEPWADVSHQVSFDPFAHKKVVGPSGDQPNGVVKRIKKAGRALPASSNSPAEQTGERNSQASKM